MDTIKLNKRYLIMDINELKKNYPYLIEIGQWLAIIPAACIGAITMCLLVRLVFWLGSFVTSATIIEYYLKEIVSSAAFGGALVFFPAYVAPRFKFKVALIFAAFLLIFFCVMLPSELVGKQYLYVLRNACAVVGAIIILFEIYE